MDSASKDSFRKYLPKSLFKDTGICLRDFCTSLKEISLSTKDSSTESTSSSKSFSILAILSSNPPGGLDDWCGMSVGKDMGGVLAEEACEAAVATIGKKVFSTVHPLISL